MFIQSIYLKLLVLSILSFSILGCGGEVEELRVQESLSPMDYVYQIEPLLTPLGCEACHTQENGGFKFNLPVGEDNERLATSFDNFLYIQQALNRIDPEESPLLKRMTYPEPTHPVYFCKQDCRYQKILTWISEVGQIDYDAIQCAEPVNESGPVEFSQCPED